MVAEEEAEEVEEEAEGEVQTGLPVTRRLKRWKILWFKRWLEKR